MSDAQPPEPESQHDAENASPFPRGAERVDPELPPSADAGDLAPQPDSVSHASDLIPGDSIPGDSIPSDLVPEELVTGDLVTSDSVPVTKFDWSWLASSLVGPGVIGFAVLNSTLALLCAMVLLKGPAILGRPEELTRWIGEFSLTNLGLAILIVPGQLTFLAFAVAGGLCSRQPFLDRLSLRRGEVSVLCWIVFALGTPTVGILMTLILNGFATIFDLEPSQPIQQIDSMLSAFTGRRLFLIIGLMAVLPGVCEELLFRGYVQSRLARTWPPFAGIGFSSICFGLAHIDPMHIFVIMPVGLWLGIIAYKSDCIWPAILGHIINNVSAILLTQMTSLGSSEEQATNVALIASLPFFVLGVGLVVGLPKKQPATNSKNGDSPARFDDRQ